MVRARILVGLASLALFLAVLAGYADRAVFNSDQFAEPRGRRAARRPPAERGGRGDHGRPGAERRGRPARRAAADRGGRLRRRGQRRVHEHLPRRRPRPPPRGVRRATQDTLTLTLTDAATLVRAALGAIRPGARRADRPGRARRSCWTATSAPVTGDLVRLAENVQLLALLAVSRHPAPRGRRDRDLARPPANGHRPGHRRRGRRRAGRAGLRARPRDRARALRRSLGATTRPKRSGTPSSATCGVPAGCWPSRARSLPRRPRRSSARSRSTSRCAGCGRRWSREPEADLGPRRSGGRPRARGDRRARRSRGRPSAPLHAGRRVPGLRRDRRDPAARVPAASREAAPGPRAAPRRVAPDRRRGDRGAGRRARA